MVSHALDLVRRFGTVVALIALVVYFTIATSGNFVSIGSIQAILNQVAVVGALGLGLTVCLVLGQFDLSVGWTASLAGILATGFMSRQGTSFGVALALALLIAAGVGLANGIAVTVLRVNAFLATLATGSIISGFINWYTISPFTTGLSGNFLALGRDQIVSIPVPAIITGGIAIVLWIFLQQVATGRRMYAVGGNQEAARIAGVRVAWLQVSAFVICALCAALGGILLDAQLGSGQPTGAVGLLLQAFAVAFLGASTWREGEFHIGGTVIGVLIFGVLFSGLAVTNAPYYLKDILTGAILIAAVGLTSLLRASRGVD